MNNPNEINWPDAVWQEINDGVLTEVNKVRVSQKVFETTVFDNNPPSISNEVINFGDLSIQEGETKGFVVIYTNFSLTSNQVKQETELHTCRTLAKMAAKALALAEDKYFFQTSDQNAKRDPDRSKSDVKFPANVKIESWKTDKDKGLLAEANPADANDGNETKVAKPISVYLAGTGNAKWGENTFKAVTEGITHLVAKAQAPDYALILPADVYADTFVPPSPASLVTTADRIRPLVEGGFYVSYVMPNETDPKEGLLVALGGEPTKLYVALEARTEYVRQDGERYYFRVVERVQYVVRDPRSLVLLKFYDKKKP
ncbi:encapsulin [Candidatus Poribacteria bacterium]|nr:encapsulin [Candidatus Poribacteria bacterium]